MTFFGAKFLAYFLRHSQHVESKGYLSEKTARHAISVPIDFNYRSARNLHQQLQASWRVAAWACTTGSRLNRHLSHL
jgi:hypothetical protein